MKNQKAFTLVELSIVLIIIGLIVGGILAGADMIRAAQLRSVISDVQKYTTAINVFKNKYNGLPGDMNNAGDFWPACATPIARCHGNNDGGIRWSSSIYYSETYRAWQILGLSGIVPRTFSGEVEQTDMIGKNVPVASVSGAGYMFDNFNRSSSGWSGQNVEVTYNHLRLGLPTSLGTSSARIGKSAINAQESFLLDTKMDDGKPGTGNMTLHYNVSSTCVSTSNTATAEYSVSNTSPDCLLHFNLNL